MAIKETILQGILKNIANIADADFQQKNWVQRGENPYACFEEQCTIFLMIMK